MSLLVSLDSVLPPPAFLQMRSVGIDISDTSLKYIGVSPRAHKKGVFSVSSWGDIDIPDGALNRGVVVQPEMLVSALKEARARTGIDMVRVSLPEERAYLFETNVKRTTSAADIRGLLEFRLEENVPLSPRDAYFDYELIPDASSAAEYRVLVTVYARETIESYYEACRAANLLPLSFEVEAQAIARATIPENDSGTYMIVDFGKTRTGVGIVHQGVLMYTSTIEIGGGDLSRELRKHLGDVSEKELTTLKNTKGLVLDPSDPAMTKAMTTAFNSILDELKARIDYWNMRNVKDEIRHIEAIILCGGSANMKGIQRYVTDQLNITAYRANVWENVFSLDDDVPPIEQRFAYGYATAIGLALGAFM